MNIPTLRDIYQARATIAPYISRTPLTYAAALSEALDAEVYLKHEEHLPLGAFKARGGINLLASMPAEERARGGDYGEQRQSRAVHCQAPAGCSACGRVSVCRWGRTRTRRQRWRRWARS